MLACADRTDIGYQGMVYVNEDTPYMKLLKPFVEKKKVCRMRKRLADHQRLAADSWGSDDRHVRHIFEPIEQWLLDEVPGVVNRYPKMQRQPKRSVARVLREIVLSVCAV